VGAVSLDQIRITPLRRIPTAGGDVLHAIKSSDPGFLEFGEAYFSIVQPGAVKAWKLHRQMTLNLVVPIGDVRFVFVGENLQSRRDETIGESNYVRLTVPPGIWFGFQGLGTPLSLILNVADMAHRPDEVLRKPMEEIVCNWKRAV
jgi:dTDP-4-dehydrorhamnose 3,5-epimerase